MVKKKDKVVLNMRGPLLLCERALCYYVYSFFL